ncbi:MAG: serine/threonine-protein kinase [Prosthecobacter sp.]|nr:serine/threonine-protein kinase [Prosthecobacter sp.]
MIASRGQVPERARQSPEGLDADAGGAARLFGLALEEDAVSQEPPWEPSAGDLIGNYHLIKKLGEGGFGIVWQAEQSQPIRRQVAVKVVRPGMDSRAVLQRFQLEKRALERMDHPNIATVLDAGVTDEGRPYFVLELVRGRPITAHCEAESLPLRGRLELFLDVCRAVQHAHQRAVLHRDLKPSNILVADSDGRPAPKVIDFGIAKALKGDGDVLESLAHTAHGMLLGTPQYMAPEQAAYGGDVADVRVDVYALGAILYELLTGAPPLELEGYRQTSLTVLLQRIHEEEAVRPSACAQARRAAGKPCPCLPEQLRGDLDWIMLKALEKLPERRYESANALADDLQRHMAYEPVSAGPPDRWYRLQKLVRRNRLAFLVTAVVAVNLVLLAVVSTLGFLREADARANAEALRQRAESNERDAMVQSQKATALADFLSRLLEQAGAFVEQGKNPEALRLAVDQSLTAIDTLKNQPELQAELLGRVAAIYGAMGDSSRALPLLQKQSELCQAVYGKDDQRTLKTQLQLARVTSASGNKRQALAIFEEIRRRLPDPGAFARLNDGEILRQFARELARQGRGEEALGLVDMAVTPDHQASVAHLRFRADLQVGMEKYAAAEESLLKALAQLAREKNTPRNRETRGSLLVTLSRAEAFQEKLPQAIKHMEESIQGASEDIGTQHHGLIGRWIEVSRLYLKAGRTGDAIHATDTAVAIARVNGSDEKLPKALRAAGEIREAAGSIESALAFRRECMVLERQNNTDRGKWIYELSEILRLQSRLKLHDDVERSCAELWAAIQAEPQVFSDTKFTQSLCATLAEVCEKWQQATHSAAHSDDLERWRAIARTGKLDRGVN